MGNSSSASTLADPSQYLYESPKPTDSRSPCPALNVLANHGYIPRDGKNVSLDLLQSVLQERMGLSWLTAKKIICDADRTVGKNGSISLADLSYHAADSIEHDGSLSRLDAALSNNQQSQFNQERFNKFLSFSKDGQFLTTEDVAAARLYFKMDSLKNNPQCIWDEVTDKRASDQAVALLHILGKDGSISIQDTKLFFEQEKFPDQWQKNPSFGIIEYLSGTRDLKNATRQLEKQK